MWLLSLSALCLMLLCWGLYRDVGPLDYHVLSHYMDIPHLVYSFPRQWALGHFHSFGYSEFYPHEHMHATPSI